MPRVKPTVSAVHLDTGHRDAFSRAIRAILATDLAETTMAQLVDGLPKADVAWEARGNLLTKAHPLADHEQLCSGVLEKTQALRNGFGPEMLSFDSQVSSSTFVTARGACMSQLLTSGLAVPSLFGC